EGRWALLPGDSERPLFRAPVGLGRGPLAHASGRVDQGAAVEGLSALLADVSREIAARGRELPAEAPEPAPARTPAGAPCLRRSPSRSASCPSSRSWPRSS